MKSERAKVYGWYALVGTAVATFFVCGGIRAGESTVSSIIGLLLGTAAFGNLLFGFMAPNANLKRLSAVGAAGTLSTHHTTEDVLSHRTTEAIGGN